MKPKLSTRKENISMNTCKQNKPETFGTETISKTLKSVNFYQQFYLFIYFRKSLWMKHLKMPNNRWWLEKEKNNNENSMGKRDIQHTFFDLSCFTKVLSYHLAIFIFYTSTKATAHKNSLRLSYCTIITPTPSATLQPDIKKGAFWSLWTCITLFTLKS